MNALLFTRPEGFLQNHLTDLAGAGFGQRILAEFDDAGQLEFAEADPMTQALMISVKHYGDMVNRREYWETSARELRYFRGNVAA